MFMPFGNNEAGRSMYRLVVPTRKETEWEISKDKSSFKLTIFTIFNNKTQKPYYGARVSVSDAALVANPIVSSGHIADLLFTDLEVMRAYLHDINNILLFVLNKEDIDRMVNLLKVPSEHNYSVLKAQWRDEYTESGVFAKCTDWFYFDTWNLNCVETKTVMAQRQWLFSTSDIEKTIDKIDAELYVLQFPSIKVTKLDVEHRLTAVMHYFTMRPAGTDVAVYVQECDDAWYINLLYGTDKSKAFKVAIDGVGNSHRYVEFIKIELGKLGYSLSVSSKEVNRQVMSSLSLSMMMKTNLHYFTRDVAAKITDMEGAGQYRVISYNPHALIGLSRSDTNKRIVVFDYQIQHDDGEFTYYGARVSVWDNGSRDSTVLFDVLFTTQEQQLYYLNRIKEGFSQEGSLENNTEVNSLEAIRNQWISEFVLVESRRHSGRDQYIEWLHDFTWTLKQVATDIFYIPSELGNKNLCRVQRELVKKCVELDDTYIANDDTFWGTLHPMQRFTKACTNLSVALADLNKNRKFTEYDIFVVFYEKDGMCFIKVISSFYLGATYKIRVGELEDRPHFLAMVNNTLMGLGFTREEIGADTAGFKLVQITVGKVEYDNVFFFVKPSKVTQETNKEKSL